MKTKLKTLVLLTYFGFLSFSCLACKSSTTDENKFEEFRKLFQPHSLPIDWNRSDIGRLGKPIYGEDKFNIIPSELYDYIPKEIIHADSVSYIRALFHLPSLENIFLFIISTDYIDDYYGDGEPFPISKNIFLIIYDNEGEMLSCKQVAGSHVDQWNQLVSIDEDYILQTRHYKFLGGAIKHPSKSHLIGKMQYTKTSCEITVNGIINCTSETIKGYFDSLPDGDYELVKEVYKDD